jgi:hypothetical protein
MKLRGRIPWTGDEVEVNLLLLPNTFVFTMFVLAPHWGLAWKFKALWFYLLDPLMADITDVVALIAFGTLIGTLWWAWNQLSL